MPQGPKIHTLQTRITGRFLVQPSTNPGPAPIFIGFHGYGENAQQHLNEIARFPGIDQWLVVSVQALHRFYERKTGTVVASWMTSQDRQSGISNNIDYIDTVLDSIRSSYDTSSVVVYSGFSQGAAMAYRAAICGRLHPAAVIALAGNIPPELRDDKTVRWPPILIGRGSHDNLYSEATMEHDLACLKKSGATIKSLVFHGGHHFHDDFRNAAGRLLSSVSRRDGSPQ